MPNKQNNTSKLTTKLTLREALKPYSDNEVMEYAKSIAKKALKRGKTIGSVDDVAQILQVYLQNESREHLVVIFLDNRNRVLSMQTLFVGTVNYVEINHREIIRAALLLNATGILLAHNHPAGCPQPSERDIFVTEELIKSTRYLGICVVDHVIVGIEGIFSFTNAGLL